MPKVARWFVRTAFLYLIFGTLLGSSLLLDKAFVLNSTIWTFLDLHITWLLIGWMLQFCMGIAVWIMPRPNPLSHRLKLAWASYGLLNGGLIFESFISVLSGLISLEFPAWVAASSTMAPIASITVIMIHLWNRINYIPKGKVS